MLTDRFGSIRGIRLPGKRASDAPKNYNFFSLTPRGLPSPTFPQNHSPLRFGFPRAGKRILSPCARRARALPSRCRGALPRQHMEFQHEALHPARHRRGHLAFLLGYRTLSRPPRKSVRACPAKVPHSSCSKKKRLQLALQPLNLQLFIGAPGRIRTHDPLVRRRQNGLFRFLNQNPTTLAIFICSLRKPQ